MEFQKFLYGTAYHPERYAARDDLLRQDIELMKQLRFNLVLLKADALRYAQGVGGGEQWLLDLIRDLADDGIETAVEISGALPSKTLLRKLDSHDRVRFFLASEEEDEATAALVRRLKGIGLEKPVAATMSKDLILSGDRELADAADILCFSSNPDWVTGVPMETERKVSYLEDRIRAVKHSSYIKCNINPVSTRSSGVRRLKRPGTLAQEVLQSAAHGARAFLYREWRQPLTGPDRYGDALIGHSGRINDRIMKEACQIGRMSRELNEIVDAREAAKTAVLPGSADEWHAAYRYYSALREGGLPVDIIDQSADFAAYSLIIAPGMRTLEEGTAEKIHSFVAGGGTWFGNLSPASEGADGSCFEGDLPYRLTDVFGMRITDSERLADGETVPLTASSDFRGRYGASHVCELLTVTDAEIVMKYDGQFYRGTPVFTRKQFGKGYAYYLATDASGPLLEDLCGKVTGGLHRMPRSKSMEEISVQRLDSHDAEYVIFQNFSGKEKRLPVEYNKLDVIFGYDPLPVFGAMVLKVPKGKRED